MVKLIYFTEIKVESQIIGKAIAENYLKEEVELEGQINTKVEAEMESQIVNKAEVKNCLIREEICSKLINVSNKR